MKNFWQYIKQQSWLIALPLLIMAGYGTSVPAAPAPSFSASAGGSTSKLTLTATMNIADADIGLSGNDYIGFNFYNTWFFNNGTEWVMFDGGAVPVYSTAPLAGHTINVVRNIDLSGLVGGKLYVGYGLNENDMMAKNKYGMVYTVTADTTAPTVSTTFHINGATNVPINTSAGIGFSEEMDSATITGANFTLREAVSGAAVVGNVSFTGVSAIFMPSNNLASSARYIVTVKGGAGGVKDLAGNAMVEDFVISWTTAAAPDTTPPKVSGTIHLNGATNVAVNTKVGATFSKAMNPLTITNANITLKKTVDGAIVAGNMSYIGVTATFTPSSDLAPKTGYTVTVKGGANGVKDLAGNPMASDFVISWTTAASPDTTAPTIIGTINANDATGIAINTKIGATFSEGMDPLAITNVNFTLKKASDGSAVAGTVDYAGVNAVFTPLNNLSSGTRYTATIKGGASGVKDLAGNPLASDYVWNWTTADYIWVPNPTPPLDRTAPTVTGTTIANAAPNVAINTTVGVTFSEGMDPLTVTTANFTLETTIGNVAVLGTVGYSGGNWIFTPNVNLANSTGYTATITTGVNDLAGNALASSYSWSFTTVAAGAAINLGDAANFGVLVGQAGGATLTNNGLATTVNGDVGASSQTNVPTLGAGFINYQNVADVPYQNALTSMTAAITDANSRTCDVTTGATNLGGLTLPPGVYCYTGAITMTGTFRMNGPGLYIFRTSSTLDAAANAIVDLNGATAANVFWVPVGATTLAADVTFKGTIMSTAAAITVGANTTLTNGRVMSGSAVTLSSNVITKP